eukprot:TRINITY_DN13984_c0_g1_i1.p1 TRINITY_DN13984_c0_g1~~TRINITY_DN13984_c0_g1_i1.p1  ORF type:complete len:70 (+),score=1.48 TRINITY_DN13984_c0_g1_i1:228-437(+)
MILLDKLANGQYSHVRSLVELQCCDPSEFPQDLFIVKRDSLLWRDDIPKTNTISVIGGSPYISKTLPCS